jgi:hypothetical protein
LVWFGLGLGLGLGWVGWLVDLGWVRLDWFGLGLGLGLGLGWVGLGLVRLCWSGYGWVGLRLAGW